MSRAARSAAVPSGPSSGPSSTEPLSRIAGPTALAAGVLMVVAELVIWPFDRTQDHSTASDPCSDRGPGTAAMTPGTDPAVPLPRLGV